MSCCGNVWRQLPHVGQELDDRMRKQAYNKDNRCQKTKKIAGKGDFSMRVAIVGSRSVTMDCYEEILPYIPRGASEIVSGNADGADQLAQYYAQQAHLPFKLFCPDYARFRKSAPLQRNIELIRYSDYVLALWDGKSRGTSHVIANCIQEYTPVHVLLIRDGKLVKTLFGQQDGHLLSPSFK